MAKCKRCLASVGCGCQLTNGLCAACNAAVNAGAPLVIEPKK